MLWIAAVVVLGLAVGLWLAARAGFVGTGEPLPGPLADLQAHLRTQGIETRAGLVRRGPVAQVHQHARFVVRDGPGRAFYVLWCESPQAAQHHLLQLRGAPSPSLPQANGTLVAYYTDWPADDPLTRRVQAAFASLPEPLR